MVREMANWLWRAALLALCAGLIGACASSGGASAPEQKQPDDRRRDSPFYVPFSA